jgi:hypothetical protein
MNPHPPADGRPLESPESLRRRLDYSDAQLRAECVVHTHRTGGPGGQHRNKTESAVRLFHRASGLVVTGEERRSQHQNAANALERLRAALAIHYRAPLPEQVVWPESVTIRDGKLRVSDSNPGLYHVLALALDALAAFGGKPQEAAGWLGVTTTSFTRFLADHPKAWQEANRIRAEFGLSPLRS